MRDCEWDDQRCIRVALKNEELARGHHEDAHGGWLSLHGVDPHLAFGGSPRKPIRLGIGGERRTKAAMEDHRGRVELGRMRRRNMLRSACNTEGETGRGRCAMECGARPDLKLLWERIDVLWRPPHGRNKTSIRRVRCRSRRALYTVPHQPKKAQLDFNKGIREKAGVSLPPFNGADMERFTVTCSHTTAGVQCLAAADGVKVDNEVMDSKYTRDGKLWKEKVLELSPSMSGPLEKGMHMLVIRRVVEEKCPMLASFIQEAGNAHRGVDARPSRLQVMFQATERLTFGHLEHQVASTLDSEYSWLDGEGKDLTAFAAAWAGGKDAKFLRNADEFARTLSVVRDPPGNILTALAKLKLSSHPEIIVAVLKTMMAAPKTFVAQNNKATIVSITDVQALTALKNRVLIDNASAFIKKATAYIESMKAQQVPANELVTPMGDMEIGFIWVILGKKVKGVEPAKTLKQVADQFLKAVPRKTGVKLPWKPAPQAPVPETVPDTTSASSSVRDFSSGGQLQISAEALTEKMLGVGCTVRVKNATKEQKVKTVKSIVDDTVTLTLNDDQDNVVEEEVSMADYIDNSRRYAHSAQRDWRRVMVRALLLDLVLVALTIVFPKT